MRVDMICLTALLASVGLAPSARAETFVPLTYGLPSQAGWPAGGADDAAILARLDAMTIRRGDLAGPLLRFTGENDRSSDESSERERPDIPLLVSAPLVRPVAAPPRTRSLASRPQPVREVRRMTRMPWMTGVFQ